jgi:hypothetical protein
VLLQKLADHPHSKREEQFINQFKVPFTPPIKLSDIPAVSLLSIKKKNNGILNSNYYLKKLLVDEQGRKYQEVDGEIYFRKVQLFRFKFYFFCKIVHQRIAHATVKIYEGTGNIKIAGPDGTFDISYFQAITHR